MVPRVEPPPRPPPQPRTLSSSTKLSFRSNSSSFAADDERSSSADHESMGPDAFSRRHGAPLYSGEDTRLTSKKELAGWYAYGFAAEVFVICGMGSFIPITLEQLARENGVLLSDRTTPCGSSSRPRPSSDTPLALMTHFMARTTARDTGQCVVYILGMEINTASFAMYTFSISVLVQSLLVISISCAADHGNFRKRLLLIFAWSGAIATMFFLPIVPKVYILGAVLAIIANTCFGASFVLLNSFLPLLVRHHPKTQYTDSPVTTSEGSRGSSFIDEEVDTDLIDPAAALLPPTTDRSTSDLTSVELQLSTELSAKGIGIGYCAGLFLQCASTILIVAMGSTTFSLRLVLFIVGLWWFLFTIPAALWLRPRPGPPLPIATAQSKGRTWIGYFIHSWVSLYRTVFLASRLRDILFFLTAWFLLSDAIATVSGVAILFAKTQLHMPPAALALISVTGTTAGILGAFTWPHISRRLSLQPTNTIIACIALFELVPLYGLAGYLPFVQSWGAGGLQQPWEMYPVAVIYGFVLGGFSSYCRSLYGELIPPGSEAAFYALYAITDKGSSIFGPAIVGVIVDRTGEIRPAFWFLVVLIGLPAPLIWHLDVGRGKEAGRRLAEVIEGFKIADTRDSVEGQGGQGEQADQTDEESPLLAGPANGDVRRNDAEARNA